MDCIVIALAMYLNQDNPVDIKIDSCSKVVTVVGLGKEVSIIKYDELVDIYYIKDKQ